MRQRQYIVMVYKLSRNMVTKLETFAQYSKGTSYKGTWLSTEVFLFTFRKDLDVDWFEFLKDLDFWIETSWFTRPGRWFGQSPWSPEAEVCMKLH